MSLETRKISLAQYILNLQQEDVLTKFEEFVASLKTKNIDWWDELTEEEKKAAQKGLKQLEDGEGIPHSEVRGRIDKMLGK